MIARLRNHAPLLAVTFALVGTAGCKKNQDKAGEAPAEQPAEEQPAATEEPATADPTPVAATEPAEDPAADFIVAEVAHAEPKPDDPVKVTFESFKVVKAEFDPEKIEGGTAELEIDLSSLSTGVEKRDGHLKSPDYFDVAKFATARVVIKDVVKGANADSFNAMAEVDLHGVKKSFPVTFKVVERTADSIRVTAEHPLKRSDFKVGKAEGDSVADDVLLKVQLTVKKTA